MINLHSGPDLIGSGVRNVGGSNPREIRRCLKRYIARQLYRTLTTSLTPAPKIN